MKQGKVVVIIEAKTDMTLKDVRELFSGYEVDFGAGKGIKSFVVHQVKAQRVEEDR